MVVSANSSWNIVNFRTGLIQALKRHRYAPVVVAPIDASAEAKLARLGVERAIVEVTRSGFNPFADLRLLGRYHSLLKNLRPICYLGFTIKPNIYGAIAARVLGIPVIANISGLGTAFMKTGALAALVTRMYRLGLSRARIVFFQNPDDLALFVTRKIVRTDQVRLLPGSGIDLERFKPGAPASSGALTFLMIARLLGDKGVREYVEAARLVRLDLPDARFQLLGPIDEGNRSAVRRGELDRWKKEGVVEYLGAADDVRSYIEQATTVVLPSYREGLPRSLLEGAAMGKPLIATDVPGCREIVQEDVTGFLCRARDSASLAMAMRKLAHLSTEQRAEIGAAARQRVQEKFSEQFVINAYLEALGKLCAF